MKQLLLILVLLLAMPATMANSSGDRLMSELLQMGSEALAKRAAKERAAEQKNLQQPPPGSLAGVVKDAADTLLENYKQDGRDYAEELSLILADKVLETPQVKSALSSVRALCVAVVIYLSVVTLIMIGLLIRLRILFGKLMVELRAKEGS
ncbi:MAG: hypothetical protein IKK45_05040 [Akkermansia sp.]|nr:hypothetical protein [Akkermansia sp.]